MQMIIPSTHTHLAANPSPSRFVDAIA